VLTCTVVELSPILRLKTRAIRQYFRVDIQMFLVHQPPKNPLWRRRRPLPTCARRHGRILLPGLPIPDH
jgi:hypothetical protein